MNPKTIFTSLAYLWPLLVALAIVTPQETFAQITTQSNVAEAASPANRPIATNPYNIASPRPEGWIVDTSGILSNEAREHISQVCEEVHQRLGKEMTVVVINTTNGKHHRQFATDLFNYWGVGSSMKNDGVLLFAAMQDRQSELILGDGVDTDENVRVAQQIMDHVVVPRFREDDPGSAMYEGIRACATRIYAVSDLDAPPELPSAKLNRAALRTHQQRLGLLPWLLGVLGLAGVGSVFGGRYWMRYHQRYCESCQNKMMLLSETEDDEHLDRGEIAEERIGSVDYDVWACLACEQVLKIRYGKLWTRYSTCPQCRYRTRGKITRTIQQATTYRGGVVRVDESCQNCTYENSHTYRTPRIVRTKTSTGGFGGSFGGGGSSSGFGGGSSSGRGASGGW